MLVQLPEHVGLCFEWLHYITFSLIAIIKSLNSLSVSALRCSSIWTELIFVLVSIWFMLLTQNWTSSKLFWYLIGDFTWIYKDVITRGFLEKRLYMNGHLLHLPPYSCLICFYVRLSYIMFGSTATPGGSNRWC